MNTSFMRLLAERLEHFFWIEVIPEDCQFLEVFDSMDGSFMSNELKFWNRPPRFIFGDEFSEGDVWLLACRSLGLGEKADRCEFVVAV